MYSDGMGQVSNLTAKQGIGRPSVQLVVAEIYSVLDDLQRADGFGINTMVAPSLRHQLANQRFVDAIVDSGDVLGKRSLAAIRTAAPCVAIVNQDDPYMDPPPERRRWTIFRRTCHAYDLLVTPRRPKAVERVRALSGKLPLEVWFSADEVTHNCQPLGATDEQWTSELVCVGTWMPGHGAFLAELIRLGVPLTICGPRWQKAAEYTELSPHIRAEFLPGSGYSKAVGGAQVALVMLNGANGDLHTTRLTEIPAIGTAMLAPRTARHLELYREDEEAVFFDDAAQCARQSHRLLADTALRDRVAAAGHRRSFLNGTYNVPPIASILTAQEGRP